ncbi:MAG: cytochrome C oxidase subunit IV family protein [Gammaproteobacteria bacterium]
MTFFLNHPVTRIWLLLIIATGASWLMGGEHQSTLSNGQMASLVLLIALIKVRFVIRHFMEVKISNNALKWTTDLWVVIVALVLLGLYWR